MAAAGAAAAEAQHSIASPMPVRQIQFPSFRPSLPQQSRLTGLQPVLSAHRVELPRGMTHTRTPNTLQLNDQAPTPQRPLPQQLQSQLWQRSNAEPVAPVAPMAVSSAEIQGTLHCDPPQAVAGSDTMMPSTALDQRLSAPAVASTAAPPHARQLPQQLPQQPPQQLPQQLPFQVAPMPHITWPQPVINWPHQVAGAAQAQAAKCLGEGMHTQAVVRGPPHLASGLSAGSAPLKGGIFNPIREQGGSRLPAESLPLQRSALAPSHPIQASITAAEPALLHGTALGSSRRPGGALLPAGSASVHGGAQAHTHPTPSPLVGSAPLQGAALGPKWPPMAPPLPAGTAPFQGGSLAPLQPSLSLVGSAPLQGGTLAAAGGSVPANVAAKTSGRSWEGVQSDAAAILHGIAMPPNKR